MLTVPEGHTHRLTSSIFRHQNIINMYERLEGLAEEEELPEEVLREAKQLGFSDKQIGGAAEGTELAVRALREKHGGSLYYRVFLSTLYP